MKCLQKNILLYLSVLQFIYPGVYTLGMDYYSELEDTRGWDRLNKYQEKLEDGLIQEYYDKIFTEDHLTFYKHVTSWYKNDLSLDDLKSVPSTTQHLHISSHNLTKIMNEAFRNLPNLLVLDLSTNRYLNDIASKAFKNLQKLKKLYLQNCKLEILSENLFLPLEELQILILKENFLWDMHMDLFNPLINLEILDLSDNLIEVIWPQQFLHLKKLKILNLSVNKLKDINFLTNNLNQLKILDISANNINITQANCFFQYDCLPNLEILIFNSNWKPFPLYQFKMKQYSFWQKINIFSSERNKNQLRYLSLRSNNIPVLPNDTFYYTRNLEYLDLSANNFDSISFDAFKYLTQLKFLSLSDCMLRSVPKLSRKVAENLRDLNLGHNLIKQIHAESFKNMRRLQRLWLDKTDIINIDVSAFKRTPQLYMLDLSWNQFQELPRDIFNNLNNLQKLWLTGNKLLPEQLLILFRNILTLRILDLNYCDIKELSRDIFKLNGYQYSRINELYLKFNNIQELKNNTFELLRGLKMLTLRRNKIKHLESKTFAGLPKLQSLHLDVNEIHELPDDIFMETIDLRYIQLEGNAITQLHPDIFNNLKNLESIILDNNEIEILPKHIFKNLPKLSTISLANNKIRTINSLTFIYSNLTYLYLDGNLLTYLDPVIFSYIKLRRIEIYSNPWQCACLIPLIRTFKQLNIIWHFPTTPTTDYLDEFCVAIDTYRTCIQDVEFNDKFWKIFADNRYKYRSPRIY